MTININQLINHLQGIALSHPNLPVVVSYDGGEHAAVSERDVRVKEAESIIYVHEGKPILKGEKYLELPDGGY